MWKCRCLLIQKRWGGYFIGGLLGLLTLGLLGAVFLSIGYHQRIFPGIMIGPTPVGGLTYEEARTKLFMAVKAYRQQWPITFSIDNKQIVVPLKDEAISYKVDESIQKAYGFGRSISITGLTELAALLGDNVRLPIVTLVNETWLSQTTASMAAMIDIPPVIPQLAIRPVAGETKVVFVSGEAGQILDQDHWQERITKNLTSLTLPEKTLEIVVSPILTTDEATKSAVIRANKLLSTSLTITLAEGLLGAQTWTLAGADLVPFVQIEGGYDAARITDYLNGVAATVNRAPKDAKFQFDEKAGKVTEFEPAEDGIVVVVERTVPVIEAALAALSRDEVVEPIILTVQKQSPSVGLNQVNSLGIHERLGVGRSTYKGSIAGRVYNVELAASRLNGTLVKPGEVFSFNAAVGEVSYATGYKAAYVIMNGRTELGDGGGVCQDSTTMFRAALDAGLPIIDRRGHAYRVGYYEQDSKPGLDATVFAPSTDFTFLNDTPGHLLIQTMVDSPKRALTIIIYGTSDGRKATIKDHVVWDITPPPPDIYQDDPTLAAGTVKQVDWKAGGAKAKFTYVVERNGEVITEKTFVTTYRPWASIYLRGTQGQ